MPNESDFDQAAKRKMLTVIQAAEIIGISRYKLYEMLKSNEQVIPHVRAGSKILIPHDGLMAWLGIPDVKDDKPISHTPFFTADKMKKLKSLLHQMIDVLFD